MPRFVIAPAYMPDGTWRRLEGHAGYPHGELLGPDRVHGTPFAGEFFPIAYTPGA